MASTPTSGADNISGDNTNNTIDGLGGYDTIQGLLGDDQLLGGNGNDKLLAATEVTGLSAVPETIFWMAGMARSIWRIIPQRLRVSSSICR
jgi:hypothetical protein